MNWRCYILNTFFGHNNEYSKIVFGTVYADAVQERAKIKEGQ